MLGYSFLFRGTKQVAQRGCGCHIPGSIQGQVGRGFEQPGLVGGISARGSRG